MWDKILSNRDCRPVCVKMASNFMTQSLAESSRPATAIDQGLMASCLKLSLVSSVFFERVQFVLGALEAKGVSPCWSAPANRRSETVHKTERGVLSKKSWEFQAGEREKLVAAFNEQENLSVSLVDEMQMNHLKELHKTVFGTSGSSR